MKKIHWAVRINDWNIKIQTTQILCKNGKILWKVVIFTRVETRQICVKCLTGQWKIFTSKNFLLPGQALFANLLASKINKNNSFSQYFPILHKICFFAVYVSVISPDRLMKIFHLEIFLCCFNCNYLFLFKS